MNDKKEKKKNQLRCVEANEAVVNHTCTPYYYYKQ